MLRQEAPHEVRTRPALESLHAPRWSAPRHLCPGVSDGIIQLPNGTFGFRVRGVHLAGDQEGPRPQPAFILETKPCTLTGSLCTDNVGCLVRPAVVGATGPADFGHRQPLGGQGETDSWETDSTAYPDPTPFALGLRCRCGMFPGTFRATSTGRRAPQMHAQGQVARAGRSGTGRG